MPFNGWQGYTPPTSWERVLSMDVGGATNNALEWGAICPETQSVVIYDELVKTTTDIRLLASLAMPQMKDAFDQAYQFRFMVGDYENRVALDDMGRNGIKFNNAVKHDKKLSIQRLSQYLHFNPKRPFPSWHPRAGQLGAPLLFITPNCKEVIKEIPMQKWKEGDGGTIKDEMDRTIKHDTVDCLLYIVRLLPAPTQIPYPKIATKNEDMDIMSKIYWAQVKQREDKLKSGGVGAQHTYRAGHGVVAKWQPQS